MSSAELAGLVVDELVALGIRDAVHCPGSRNAPLAYALHAADADGRLRLHVRIDERGAGFLALALAAATDRPVPVCTTSGTAAANLHPAVLEAAHRGVPLLAITADRPPELLGSGANQTTDQHALFGTAVRWAVTLDAAVPEPARRVVDRLVGWATGARSADPGPAHLNLAFREPLVAPPVAPSASGRPATVVVPAVDGDSGAPPALPAARTVLVAGDGGAALRAGVSQVVARHRWPVVAEASAGMGALAFGSAAALLADPAWLSARTPQRAIVVGNPTLHRPVQSLLHAAAEVVVVARGPRWPDAAAVADLVVPPSWLAALAAAEPVADAADWAASWADSSAVERVRETVRASWPSGPAVAATLYAALPAGSAIQLGSSNPVRDVDLAAVPRDDVLAVANRGLAGIDGTVSSAVGLALARPGRPTYALLGDLTFQHDVTGLMIGPGEPRPDLTIVVANDDGGGIFATLEQGAAEVAEPFERMFGTPTGVRLRELCAAVGATHRELADPAELAAAVSRPPAGITVLEVRTDRTAVRELHRRLTGH